MDECNQVRCEVRALEGERAKLSEKQRKLEDQKRKVEEQERRLEERKRKLEDQKRKLQVQRLKLDEQKRKMEMQLQPLRREVNQVQQNLPLKRACLADLCNVREAENAQRLDRLLPEVWEKILDELKEDDHFPLALSCRFFRQKQKELVARRTQQGRESGKSPLALKTTLFQKREKGQLVSSEYIRFCSEENARGYQIQKSDPYETFHHPDEVREWYLMCLAAFHGHLHLLNQSALSGRAFDNYGGCGEYGEYGEYDEYGEFQEDYEYGAFYGGDYSEGEENEERGYYLQTLFDPEGESISVYAGKSSMKGLFLLYPPLCSGF